MARMPSNLLQPFRGLALRQLKRSQLKAKTQVLTQENQLKLSAERDRQTFFSSGPLYT